MSMYIKTYSKDMLSGLRIKLLIKSLIIIVLFQQCTTHKREQKDVIFDSLLIEANHKLKTNADSALIATKKLDEYATIKNDANQMFESSYLRGRAFEFADKSDSALCYYHKILSIALQLNDTSKIVQSFNSLGRIYLEKEVLDSVATYFRKGLSLAALINDTIQQAGFTTNMGLYYDKINKTDSAMQCYTKAAFFYEELHDSVNIALLYRNLGSVFLAQGLNKKAITYYKDAININKKLNNKVEIGLDYSNLAIAFKPINKDSVKYFYEKAMDIISGYGSLTKLTMVKFNYANYLKSIGKIDDAEKTYKEVLKVSLDNNILIGQLYAYNLLGKIAVIRKNEKLANEYFLNSLKLAKENKLTTDILRLYYDIFEGNMELKNINQSTKYFQLWSSLNDSLQTQNQQDLIVKYQSIYESEKKSTEIKLLTKEREKDKLKHAYLLYILITSLIIVLAILYVLWLRSKYATQRLLISEQIQKTQLLELNKNELQLINQEQEAKLVIQELESNQKLLLSKMLLISHNSEFLSDILQKLQSLNQELITNDQQDKVKEIIIALSSEVNSKKWVEFQQQYFKSHEDFYNELNKQHPNLTAGEYRMCILLKMNLSIKEIAELTMQTPKAIEMARYRLRIKFKLEREDNLTSYLSSF